MEIALFLRNKNSHRNRKKQRWTVSTQIVLARILTKKNRPKFIATMPYLEYISPWWFYGLFWGENA